MAKLTAPTRNALPAKPAGKLSAGAAARIRAKANAMLKGGK